MIFLLVLAVATTAALMALRGREVRTAARWGLGIAMVVAGLGHLATPTPFEQHLPEWVPAASALIAGTGLIEIALGVALALVRGRRRLVGIATAVYLAAVFPANVYVAVAGVDVDGQPGGVYSWLRLPFQALFIAWALWSTAQPAKTKGGVIPPLPWTLGPSQPSDSAATAMVSRLVLRRFRDVPAFLGAALRLRSLFRQSPGAIRLSLQAVPMARTFWTLSTWESDESLNAYARHPLHVEVMRRFGPELTTSTFLTWTTPASELPAWPDARARVAAAEGLESGDTTTPRPGSTLSVG